MESCCFIAVFKWTCWFGFCQRHTLKSSGKRENQMTDAYVRLAYRQVCGAFAWLTINMAGMLTPLWLLLGRMVLGCIKHQAESAVKCARKQCSSLVPVCFCWVSSLTSPSDWLWWECVSQIRPFPSWLAFGYSAHSSNRKQTRTVDFIELKYKAFENSSCVFNVKL